MPDIQEHRLLTSEHWDIHTPNIRMTDVPYAELNEIFLEQVVESLGVTHRLQDNEVDRDEEGNPLGDPYFVRYYHIVDILRKIVDRIEALEA